MKVSSEKEKEMTVLRVNSKFDEEPKKEVAFTHDGIDYYHFTEGGTAIYFQRFRALQNAMQKHEEWKVTDEVLTEFVDMVQKFAGEGNTSEILGLVQKFKWRRTQNEDFMLMYELASIWYFDESEDPAIYDASYCRVKIERWRKSGKLLAFFLRTPLNKYIDFSSLLGDGMQKYLLEMHLTLYAQSAMNLLRLSESEKLGNTGKNITYLMETYSDLAKLIDTELPSITAI